MTNPTPPDVSDVATELIPRKVRGWFYLIGSVGGYVGTSIAVAAENLTVAAVSGIVSSTLLALAAFKTPRS